MLDSGKKQHATILPTPQPSTSQRSTSRTLTPPTLPPPTLPPPTLKPPTPKPMSAKRSPWPSPPATRSEKSSSATMFPLHTQVKFSRRSKGVFSPNHLRAGQFLNLNTIVDQNGTDQNGTDKNGTDQNGGTRQLESMQIDLGDWRHVHVALAEERRLQSRTLHAANASCHGS